MSTRKIFFLSTANDDKNINISKSVKNKINEENFHVNFSLFHFIIFPAVKSAFVWNFSWMKIWNYQFCNFFHKNLCHKNIVIKHLTSDNWILNFFLFIMLPSLSYTNVKHFRWTYLFSSSSFMFLYKNFFLIIFSILKFEKLKMAKSFKFYYDFFSPLSRSLYILFERNKVICDKIPVALGKGIYAKYWKFIYCK